MTTHIVYPYFTITPKMTQRLEAIGVVIGYLQAASIPPDYRKEMVSKVTAEIVHTSSPELFHSFSPSQRQRFVQY